MQQMKSVVITLKNTYNNGLSYLIFIHVCNSCCFYDIINSHNFQQHVYVSLSEIQIRQEEEMTRNPLSHPETDIPQTPAEILYQVGSFTNFQIMLMIGC